MANVNIYDAYMGNTGSRYASTATNPAGISNPGGTRVGGNTSTNQSQTGSSQTTGSSNTNQHTDSTQQTNSSTSTQNMTGSAMAALENLIAQLMGGGTQQMAEREANLRGEINQNQAQRAAYSKEAAFADAQGLIAQTMKQTLESLMPGINRAAAGAGASQGSMRALLTQQAADRAAQAASAQGAQMAANYGQISNTTSGIIANLINSQQDQATNALLQALGIAKGAVQTSNTSSTTTGTQDTQSNTQSQQNTNTQQNTSGNTTVSPSGTGGTTNTNTSANDGLVYYGPQASAQQLAQNITGSSLDTLLQLAGTSGGYSSSDWSGGFTF